MYIILRGLSHYSLAPSYKRRYCLVTVMILREAPEGSPSNFPVPHKTTVRPPLQRHVHTDAPVHAVFTGLSRRDTDSSDHTQAARTLSL